MHIPFRAIRSSAAPLLLLASTTVAAAGFGETGFLGIVAGGRPAGLGGAYVALARDAYATVFNPAGLGDLPSAQFAGMHLAYLAEMSYNFAGLALPTSKDGAIGAAVQSLRSGDAPATDDAGLFGEDVSTSFQTYSLSYGHAMTERFSLGVTAKLIHADLAGFGAQAYAGDAGAMYRPRENLALAAAVSNVGSKMTFLEEEEDLPTAVRAGAAYIPHSAWTFSVQGTRLLAGSSSGQAGVEWRSGAVSLRAGYRSETTRRLDAAAGVTAGLSLHLGSQQFDYAWVPVGDLGETHYFSLVLRWGDGSSHAGTDEFSNTPEFDGDLIP